MTKLDQIGYLISGLNTAIFFFLPLLSSSLPHLFLHFLSSSPSLPADRRAGPPGPRYRRGPPPSLRTLPRSPRASGQAQAQAQAPAQVQGAAPGQD